MGLKLSIPALTVIHFIYDFSLNPQAGVGAVNIGDLPDGFIVQSMRLQELVGLTATTTVALGEDGGGDADGYLAAVDPAATQKCTGALLGVAGGDLEHVVDPNKDGIVLTTAFAPAIVGKVAIFVQGYQTF